MYGHDEESCIRGFVSKFVWVHWKKSEMVFLSNADKEMFHTKMQIGRYNFWTSIE